MAFTVFSVGIFAEDKTKRFPESQEEEQEEVIPKEIHYFETLEEIHSFEEKGEDFYIVVFDVGTTGTRAHVFHFGRSANGKKPFSFFFSLLWVVIHRKNINLEYLYKNTKPCILYMLHVYWTQLS